MLLIAEIGLNHDGSLPLARELIREAARCGADVAKFQIGWRSGPGEINALTPEDWRGLKEACEYEGVEFLASVITGEALEVVKWLGCGRVKVASRTVVEAPELVEAMMREDWEVLVSLGWWEEEGFPFGPPSERLRYLYCRSSYPTSPEELREMPGRFGPEGYYGYSDHLLGIGGCLLAIARGARVVEKHFTVNKAQRSVHGDHVLSADPRELRALHEQGRELARVVGAIT